jgi:dienelactone hydrolase
MIPVTGEYVPALRAKVIELMGTLPASCPLRVEVLESTRRDGLAWESIRYESSPGEWVPAEVIRPEAAEGALPGLVCCHGHGGVFELGRDKHTGRSELYRDRSSGRIAVEAAAAGFVVIVPDMLCFQDRRPPAALREANPTYRGFDYELFEFWRAHLSGSTLQARYAWDLHRAAEVLRGRPDVLAEKVGVFGISLGGQETLFAMILDERLAAGVCCCGIGRWEAIFRDGVQHNKAAYLPGMLRHFDSEGVVAAIAPRPLLLLAGERDAIFPVDSVRDICRTAAWVYCSLGAEAAFTSYLFPAGHEWPADMRDYAFKQWLKAALK